MDGQLWGVLIGGLLAVLGGAASPWMQHRLGKAERDKNFRRESVVAVIRAIRAHEEYSAIARENLLFGKSDPLPPNPIAEIEGVVLTMFPNSILRLRMFTSAASRQAWWATKQATRRLSGESIDLSDWAELARQYSLAASNLAASVSGQDIVTYEATYGEPEPPAVEL